jgi:hypothetical protein
MRKTIATCAAGACDKRRFAGGISVALTLETSPLEAITPPL